MVQPSVSIFVPQGAFGQTTWGLPLRNERDLSSALSFPRPFTTLGSLNDLIRLSHKRNKKGGLDTGKPPPEPSRPHPFVPENVRLPPLQNIATSTLQNAGNHCDLPFLLLVSYVPWAPKLHRRTRVSTVPGERR